MRFESSTDTKLDINYGEDLEDDQTHLLGNKIANEGSSNFNEDYRPNDIFVEDSVDHDFHNEGELKSEGESIGSQHDKIVHNYVEQYNRTNISHS